MPLATDLLAGYAALVSTGSLGWQMYSWKLARRNQVEVTVAPAVAGFANSAEHVIALKVVNRSEHTIQVAGVGLDFQDGSGKAVHQVGTGPTSELPGPVESHAARSTVFKADDLRSQGFDLFKPIMGWARLATGEVVRSEPTVTLRPD